MGTYAEGKYLRVFAEHVEAFRVWIALGVPIGRSEYNQDGITLLHWPHRNLPQSSNITPRVLKLGGPPAASTTDKDRSESRPRLDRKGARLKWFNN
jgi:hypothetical protein